MAHPFRAHRAHLKQRDRVEHITGQSHGDAAEDRAMIKKAIKSHEMKMHDTLHGQHMHGGDAAKRMDKPQRAHGGRIRHKKANGGKATHVNIMIGQHGPGQGMAPPAGPPPMAPPRPPMLPPPGGPPGGAPGMGAGPVPMLPGPAGAPPMGPGAIPPALAAALAGGAKPPMAGLPPGVGGPGMLRRDGGGTYKRGGAVKRAAGGYTPTNKGTKVFREGLAAGTHIQHADGKDDQANIGRGKPITYKRGGKIHRATGGPVEAPEKPVKASPPDLPGGSGGGEARLYLAKRARKNYKAPPPSYNEED